MKKCLIYSCFQLFAFHYLSAQAHVVVKSGANWVQKDQVRLVLKDISLVNEGNMPAEQSRIIVRGDAATANTILSTANDVYDLEIDKSTNGLQLGQQLTITNQLILTSGYLNIDSYDVIFENATIVGESATEYITGTTGAIEMTMDINAPSQLNPGNFGIQLTSSADLGSTLVRRGHAPQTNGPYAGINRYVTIEPTNNSGLNATLRMYYADSELNGIPESELEFWRFDGAEWVKRGFTSRNTTENWVELTSIDAFSTWTLSNDDNPLPIELLRFYAEVNDDNSIELFWQTTNEVNNDVFSVERSQDGKAFQKVGQISGAGDSRELTAYNWIDISPLNGLNFYRLTQTDFDGTTVTYEPIVVDFAKASSFVQLYPNPTKGVVHLKTNIHSELHLFIFSLDGTKVMDRMVDGTSQKLDLTKDVSTGSYLLKVMDASGTVRFNELIIVN